MGTGAGWFGFVNVFTLFLSNSASADPTDGWGIGDAGDSTAKLDGEVNGKEGRLCIG
jgi:hypothetical protein